MFKLINTITGATLMTRATVKEIIEERRLGKIILSGGIVNEVIVRA